MYHWIKFQSFMTLGASAGVSNGTEKTERHSQT